MGCDPDLTIRRVSGRFRALNKSCNMTALLNSNIRNFILVSSLLVSATGCEPKAEKVLPKKVAKPEAKAAVGAVASPQVVLKTTKGDITIELYPEKAPITVANFLKYVDDGFFDGVVFHRVMDGFMIQCGGFELKKDGTIEQKITRENIQNESKNGLSNEKGTLAMARLNDPHSASAQFFINHKHNSNLDGTPGNWGYAVFGKVIEGMDVVDAIAGVATTTKPLKVRARGQVFENPMKNVPVENVIIESAKRK